MEWRAGRQAGRQAEIWVSYPADGKSGRYRRHGRRGCGECGGNGVGRRRAWRTGTKNPPGRSRAGSWRDVCGSVWPVPPLRLTCASPVLQISSRDKVKVTCVRPTEYGQWLVIYPLRLKPPCIVVMCTWIACLVPSRLIFLYVWERGNWITSTFCALTISENVKNALLAQTG